MGDNVLAARVLFDLRRRFPSAHISVLAAERFYSLYDPTQFDAFYGLPLGCGRLGRSVSLIRKIGATHAVILAPSMRSALECWLARVPIRMGVAWDNRELLLTHSIRIVSGTKAPFDRHQLHIYQSLVDMLGGEVKAADTSPFSLVDVPKVPDFSSAQRSFPHIVLNAHGRFETRRWPESYFVELALRLRSAAHRVSLLQGGNEVERARVLRLNHQIGDSAVTVGPKTSGIPALSRFLSDADVLVTGDSGPAHLAAKHNTATVVIYGSTDPALTGPVSDNTIALRAEELLCSGCYRKQCLYALECLSSIGVEQVLQAISQSLNVPNRLPLKVEKPAPQCP